MRSDAVDGDHLNRQHGVAIRLITVVIATCMIGGAGCHRGKATTAIVPVPAGLDSAGVARWLSEQHAACGGRLVSFFDEGGTSRDFDAPATRPVSKPDFRYTAGIIGVQCQR